MNSRGLHSYFTSDVPDPFSLPLRSVGLPEKIRKTYHHLLRVYGYMANIKKSPVSRLDVSISRTDPFHCSQIANVGVRVEHRVAAVL